MRTNSDKITLQKKDGAVFICAPEIPLTIEDKDVTEAYTTFCREWDASRDKRQKSGEHPPMEKMFPLKSLFGTGPVLFLT